MNVMHEMKFAGRVTGNNIRHDWKKETVNELEEVKMSTVEFRGEQPLDTYTQFQLKGFFAIGSVVLVTAQVIEENLPTLKNQDYEDLVVERDNLKVLVNRMEAELADLRQYVGEKPEKIN